MENKLFVFLISINVSTVLMMGNLVVNHGKPCSVSSHIPGMKSAQTMTGTCYPSLICRHKGGEVIGRCGISDVCCIFARSCGDTTVYNSTYFVNHGYPLTHNNSNTCLLSIHRTYNIHRICQLRLDFLDFELIEPNKGECDTDFFTVNGQNLNSVVPKLCGFNSGQHYIDDVKGPINLIVQTYGAGQRRWNILVSQIECNNPSKAPPNCLQYFMGPNGEITSFNYNALLQTDSKEKNSDLISKEKGVSYINNLDYSICFRKEQYFCTQTYSVESSNLVNTLNDHSLSISSDWVASGAAGAGISECPTDYLLLNGIRFCGSRLNSGAVKQNNIDINGVITDDGTGPFIARFVSDGKWSEENSRGFKLSFKQNPCLLQFPNTQQILESTQKTESIAELKKQGTNSEMCKIAKFKI